VTVSKPISVLRLAPHFFRAGNWPVAYDPVGGMQNQVWQLAKALDEAGVSQTIVTTYIPESERSFALFNAVKVRCVGFYLPELLAPHLLNLTWFLALIPFLLRNLRAHQIVHIHLNHSIWCRLLAFVVKLSRTPLVISLNVSLVSDGETVRAPAARFHPAEWLERCALAMADGIVALTRRQSDTVCGLIPGKLAQVRIIPDTIDAVSFGRPLDPSAIADFRTRYGIPSDAKVVSYIGRISEEKGWRDLPVLVERLSREGVFVLICGDGPRRKHLERKLREAAPGGRWHVTGFVPQSDVKAALSISALIMLPSRREAFGSILLEAMASGVPAVAYRVGGIADVAGEPNAVALVPPRDTEAFVKMVLDLLSRSDLCQALARRGAERVHAFSPLAARDQFIHLYRGLAWS
jgi:glycosyltransferase involved in cell wall biosynthesis